MDNLTLASVMKSVWPEGKPTVDRVLLQYKLQDRGLLGSEFVTDFIMRGWLEPCGAEVRLTPLGENAIEIRENSVSSLSSDQSTMRKLLPSINFYPNGALATKRETQVLFVNSLMTVWDGLPQGDRLIMQDAWERSSQGKIEIQIVDDSRCFRMGPSGNATAQFTYHLGCYEIVFKSIYATKLSEASRRYWIAHELGHLFLNITDPGSQCAPQTAEDAVEALLESRWGYGSHQHARLCMEESTILRDESRTG